MKKNPILFFFWIIPFSLFSQTYYEATAFGIPIREISSAQIEEFEYVLIYSESDNRVVRQLLKETKEIKKWERIIKWKDTYQETEYDKEHIVSIIYVEGALIIREDLYFEGELSEIRRYTYENRELKGTTVENAKGELLYHNKYLTATNGRLARVVQSQPNKGDLIYSYQYSGNDLQHVITQESDLTINYRYKKGKLFSVEHKKGDQLLFYKENPLEGVKKTIQKDTLSDLYIQNFYNTQNRIIQSITWKDNEKSVASYQYDKKGNLIEKTIRSKGSTERYQYSYQEEKLSTRSYYKNEELLKKALFSAPNDYVETLYRKGVPLFEITYKDNVKTKVEFLSPIVPKLDKNPLQASEEEMNEAIEKKEVKSDNEEKDQKEKGKTYTP